MLNGTGTEIYSWSRFPGPTPRRLIFFARAHFLCKKNHEVHQPFDPSTPYYGRSIVNDCFAL